MSVNDPASLAYIITKADKYNSFGQYDKAVETMNDFMSKNDLSEHEKAICAWTLAESYRYLNDAENQKEQLIISSIGRSEGCRQGICVIAPSCIVAV